MGTRARRPGGQRAGRPEGVWSPTGTLEATLAGGSRAAEALAPGAEAGASPSFAKMAALESPGEARADRLRTGGPLEACPPPAAPVSPRAAPTLQN